MSAVKRGVVACIVMAFVLGSSFFVYTSISRNEEGRSRDLFHERVSKFKQEVSTEVERYENLIATLGAFFNSSEQVSYSEFNQFVEGLGTEKSYPGVKGLGYAQKLDSSQLAGVVSGTSDAGVIFEKIPEPTLRDHATLMYFYPPSEDAPTGSDIFEMAGGHEGLNDAITRGKVSSSEPMSYTFGNKDVRGYILAFPVKNGSPYLSGAKQDENYTGWAIAYIDATEFLHSLPSREGLTLHAVDSETGGSLIDEKIDTESPYYEAFSYEVGGRDRTVQVNPGSTFISENTDRGQAVRYAFLVANLELVALLIGVVAVMHKTRKKREGTLTHQAAHDVLTGLPNRYFLEKWLEGKVSVHEGTQEKVAVLFIDLDGFKAVNDTLGHDIGDELLTTVAQRLQKEVRDKDVLARLGGDEFLVVLEEVDDEIQATRIAERLIEVIRFPVMVETGPVCVGASIGIAITAIDASTDSASIIRFADAAMYAAKEDKTESVRVFDNKLKSVVDGRHEVEASIRGATSRSEIIDVLQPLVNLADGATYGYEALCRWSHPVFGVLSPDQFLDAAKVTGEIIEIDRWMVNKAFQTAIAISSTSHVHTRVWVNLSVRHLLQGEFYQHVMHALRNSETTADMLGVEIEEDVFKIDDSLLYPFLNQLRELGILIALDDFGSEDASLQALKRYSYDIIKLDRSLISEFTLNPSTSIVPAVVELAHGQGMRVVATGVETAEQLNSVIEVGCDIVQGYVFSEPRAYSDLLDRQEGFTWPMPLGVARKKLIVPETQEIISPQSAQEA